MSSVFMLLLPLQGLAERFEQLEEPDFIRARREQGLTIEPHTSWDSRRDGPEIDFYIRSWKISFSMTSFINVQGYENLTFHDTKNIITAIENKGHRYIARSINRSVDNKIMRGLDIKIGFQRDIGISQCIRIQIHQNLQGIMGMENQVLAVCHYPWHNQWVAEDEALPTIMLLRKVVEILQPDFGWHDLWESVCDAWHLDDPNSDEPATPLNHDPAPWRTYRRACVFGPSMQALLNLEHLTDDRYGNIFNNWRDGNMLWFKSPSGFDIEYGAHKIQVDDPNGTWWMHLDPRGWQTIGNINDAFHQREVEHEETMNELIARAARN